MASSDAGAARRYSRALFNVALERGEVDSIASSLELVTRAVAESPELLAVLRQPLITRQRKNELLSHAFQGAIAQDVSNFLLLVVEKDRASIIPSMAREFGRLVDAHRGVTDAEVTSASALTEAQNEAVLAQLQKATGHTIRLKSRVDENILGGLIIRIGDKLIDGSVTTQLVNIREQMKRVKVN